MTIQFANYPGPFTSVPILLALWLFLCLLTPESIQGDRNEHLLSAMFVPVNLLNKVLLSPCFTEKEICIQRGKTTCPGLHKYRARAL